MSSKGQPCTTAPKASSSVLISFMRSPRREWPALPYLRPWAIGLRLCGRIRFLHQCIPDGIPVIGIADDLAVLGLALKLSEKELQAFSEWRAGRA